MAVTSSNGKRAKIFCSKEVLVSTKLHISHGSALKIQNVKWLVTGQRVSAPLFGRPILDRLGLNTRELIATTADRFAANVDLERMVAATDRLVARRVLHVMEGISHADKGETKGEDVVKIDGWYWWEIWNWMRRCALKESEGGRKKKLSLESRLHGARDHLTPAPGHRQDLLQRRSSRTDACTGTTNKGQWASGPR